MIITKSEKETMTLAKKFASRLKGGEVVALIGELGAGKTVFIKGLAKGLGVKQTITSPTFVLMKIYPVKCRKAAIPLLAGLFNRVNPVKRKKIKYLCHIDAYRLKNGQELIGIGLNDWLSRSDVITVIEWADRVREILPKKSIKIRLNYGKKEDERIVEIT